MRNNEPTTQQTAEAFTLEIADLLLSWERKSNDPVDAEELLDYLIKQARNITGDREQQNDNRR